MSEEPYNPRTDPIRQAAINDFVERLEQENRIGFNGTVIQLTAPGLHNEYERGHENGLRDAASLLSTYCPLSAQVISGWADDKYGGEGVKNP